MSADRGGFRSVRHIMCGKCSEQDLAYDAKDAKLHGWRYTKALGWRCPECVKRGETP